MTDAPEAHPATTAKHAPTYAHLFLAGLIALVGGAMVGSVAGNGSGRSDFSPPDLNELEATLHWGSPTEVEIEFIWMSTAATRGASDSIFGDNPGYHEAETLTLAKATIENVSQSRIRIGELDLHLKAANGVVLDTMAQSVDARIDAGETREVHFRKWIPTPLVGSVVGFSGGLQYTESR